MASPTMGDLSFVGNGIGSLIEGVIRSASRLTAAGASPCPTDALQFYCRGGLCALPKKCLTMCKGKKIYPKDKPSGM